MEGQTYELDRPEWWTYGQTRQEERCADWIGGQMDKPAGRQADYAFIVSKNPDLSPTREH
jgi:hypothetical protein